MEEQRNSWSGMADQVMKTWTEVGTQAWKSWFDVMGSGIHDPLTDNKSGLEFESINQSFVNYQQLQLRLLKLSYNAWQEIFPKLESGNNWEQTLNNYTQKLRNQVEEFSKRTFKSTQDTAELWQVYIKEIQKLNQWWTNALGLSIKPLSKAVATSTSEPWIELNDLYWNLLYEETFGGLTQTPPLGLSREFNGKIMRGFDAWIKLYRASIDYQVVLNLIQMQSFEKLIQELTLLAEKGEKVKEWQQFLELWCRIADEVFEKAFCCEDNLKVRGKFLNALNNYKLCQQQLMEVWMTMMNIPVRSEVDEVHKNIYELRKEVKSIKKTLAKYEALLEKLQ
jgi:class III poly(R)-hydroxyalkanoic acid synthase PhaE subunit